jgi:hypothetical protein
MISRHLVVISSNVFLGPDVWLHDTNIPSDDLLIDTLLFRQSFILLIFKVPQIV